MLGYANFAQPMHRLQHPTTNKILSQSRLRLGPTLDSMLVVTRMTKYSQPTSVVFLMCHKQLELLSLKMLTCFWSSPHQLIFFSPTVVSQAWLINVRRKCLCYVLSFLWYAYRCLTLSRLPANLSRLVGCGDHVYKLIWFHAVKYFNSRRNESLS